MKTFLKHLLHAFLNKDELISVTDQEIILKQTGYLEASSYTANVDTVLFNIIRCEDKVVLGRCELRLGFNDDIYYLGQIGYSVVPKYRGHNYAFKASKLLLSLAYNAYGMKEVIITCSPNNLASYKTLLKLNGELLEIVKVPKSHYLYQNNEKEKCIFRYILKE